MTSTVLRRTLDVMLVGAVLCLAACASAPTPEQRPPLPALQPITIIPVTQVPDSDANPGSPAAGAGAITPATAPADAATQSGAQPVIAAADYADLFDRIRAGFQLPDSDHKAIDRELDWYVGNPDYLDRAFRRSDLYLYHIVTELEARGMPRELALLPVVESAYEPYAYSRARASGLWQFIPDTGSRYNLKQDWWYDGRRDVVESTRAALDYLKDLHAEFGDWLLAIAAYNCGEVNVERAVARNQAAGLPTDFWSLKLPAETRAYVPKLLAMKRLVADPEHYGLSLSKIPNQPYFVQVDIKSQIDMRVAAEIAGVTYDELYELNPAFHRWATDPTGPYYLLMPTEAANAFRAGLAQLSPDQRLRVQRYTVRRGDTLAAVARRFRTTAQVVRDLNDLTLHSLVIGSELRIPSDTVTLPAKALRAAALVDANFGRHARRQRSRIVVRRGETLWAIARKHGVDVNALALMNGLQPNDVLRTGQRLRLAATGNAYISVNDEDSARAVAAENVGRSHSRKRGAAVSTRYSAGNGSSAAFSSGRTAGGSGAGPSLSTAAMASASLVDGDSAGSAGFSGRSAEAAASHFLTHIVRLGDTLYHVAREYHVSMAQVISWNRLASTTLVPGQKLVIRGPRG